MRHSVIRFLTIGFLASLSGCAFMKTDAPEMAFQAKPPPKVTSAPIYQVGDQFRYRVGEAFIMEKVERIDAEGVWWRSSDGRRWVGGDRSLAPPQMVEDVGGKPTIQKAKIESTGALFPLTLGQKIAFRLATQKDGMGSHSRSCAIEGFGAVMTSAGPFDAYRMHCVYDGVALVNYYAPMLGRVVLQTRATEFEPVERELVGFIRRIETPKQMAEGNLQPAAKSVSKPVAATSASAKVRYGVQIAAYRSPKRIKRTWARIKRRGGRLLATSKPSVERHEKNGAALYRLIVGDFASQDQARAHCRALKRNKVDCWPRARSDKKSSPLLASSASPKSLRVVSR